MDCECIHDIEKRQGVINLADLVIAEVVEQLGSHCEAIVEFGVEQVVLRLVHLLASMRHLEREYDDPKVYEEVRKILTKFDRQSPALLGTIIQEYRAKENVNACH